MRIVIFHDRYSNKIHPRKFYDMFPRITELEQKHYFTFGYLYGTCERIEFLDYDGYVTGEITILNKDGVKAYD